MSREELFKAINNGDLKKVKLLVKRGADIEETDDCEYTALLEAVYYDQLDIVKYLVKQGANINTKSEYNRTALHIAVNDSNLEMVKFLVENGVYINAKNTSGETALDVAIKEEKTEIEEYLQSIELEQKGLIEDETNKGRIIPIEEIQTSKQRVFQINEYEFLIKRPDLFGGAIWDVLFLGSWIKITINDKVFLQKVREGQVDFFSGSELVGDVEIIVKIDENQNVIDVKHTILLVHKLTSSPV